MVILIFLYAISKTILVKHLNKDLGGDLKEDSNDAIFTLIIIGTILQTILMKNLDGDLNILKSNLNGDLNNFMDNLKNDFDETSSKDFHININNLRDNL